VAQAQVARADLAHGPLNSHGGPCPVCRAAESDAASQP
jgi:hypothetical protein